MHLTEDRLHAIALEAREGLRDCLGMIELHGRDSQRAFLNPATVVNAAATWERFTVDLVFASEKADWAIEDAGWDRGAKVNGQRAPDPAIPWPGGRFERESQQLRTHTHELDDRLVRVATLSAPLTACWQVYVARSWSGADPDQWQLVSYSDALQPGEAGVEIIRQAILGAKSARDAAAHRLYYKKAAHAQGKLSRDATDDRVDLDDWCYVWQSDNTNKSNGSEKSDENPYPGKPTIQSGYARGVVALFLQLIDQSIAAVREQHGWRSRDSGLPREWFSATIPRGRFAGLEPWGGQELSR